MIVECESNTKLGRWDYTNGKLVSRFEIKGLKATEPDYPHYTIINASKKPVQYRGRWYDRWQFNNLHLSTDSKTHYYFEETDADSNRWRYAGANNLKWVGTELDLVLADAKDLIENYFGVKATLAAQKPSDATLRVDSSIYDGIQKTKEAGLAAIVNAGKAGTIRDWTTPGKWHPKKRPMQGEMNALAEHYKVNSLDFTADDWMAVLGQDKAPSKTVVTQGAQADTGTALYQAKQNAKSPAEIASAATGQ